MSHFTAQACIELRPTAGISVEGDVITWHNIKTDDIPTDKEISAKVTELENAEPLRILRAARDQKLAQSDWIVIKEREEGGSVSNFADWKTYRQALRDVTKTYKTLDTVKWPTAPSE